MRDLGAAGDGRALDTAAIQRAVEACNAEGGGLVRLSPGSDALRLPAGVDVASAVVRRGG